jgi:hypothetical protein
MKRFLLLLAVLLAYSPVFSQDEASADTLEGWKVKGTLSLNVSQSSFTNWAGGGENSMSGNILFGGIANYKMNKTIWENTLLTTYGSIIKGGDANKTDDRLEINSKYGYQAFKNEKWYLSAIMNFKTQYTPGYANDGDSILVSNFMSPGYLNLGLGFDWQQSEVFSMNIAPVDAKFIFVLDQELANKGDYGVDAAVLDTAGNIITPGKNMRFKFGAYVRATFNKEVFKNVNVYSTLDLFSNYLKNPQNIDVNWELLISLKINDWLAASINTTLIYDADITFERVNADGVIETYGPRTQFKEVFNLGLTFNFK